MSWTMSLKLTAKPLHAGLVFSSGLLSILLVSQCVPLHGGFDVKFLTFWPATKLIAVGLAVGAAVQVSMQ